MGEVIVGSCSVCGNDNLEPWLTRSDNVAVIQCANCSMGIRSSYPEDLSTLYEDSYYEQDGTNGIGYEDYESTATHALSWVAPLVRLVAPTGSVLDIGSANGYLLDQLASSHRTSAIEMNASLAEECAKKGHAVLGPDLLEVDASAQEPFTVITAISVLEHLADIRAGLQRARDLLADSGVLLFEVPVLTGDDHLDKSWLTGSLEHIWYPTPAAISPLFKGVFGHDPAGGVVEIDGFANVWIGMASPDAALQAKLHETFERVILGPVAALQHDEVATRFMLEVICGARLDLEAFGLIGHAAVSGPGGCLGTREWERIADIGHRMAVHRRWLAGENMGMDAKLNGLLEEYRWMEGQRDNWETQAKSIAADLDALRRR